MALTKAELAESLIEVVSNKRDAKQIVELFFEEICKNLEKGTDVKISGLGNFRVRVKKARPGRNPKTGEEVSITARRVATFHPDHKLRSQILKNIGKLRKLKQN